MQLYIPHVGECIVLDADWTFQLYDEYRNEKLFKALGKPLANRYGGGNKAIKTTIPQGTKLKIDRVYIRSTGFNSNGSDYDSLTFVIVDCPSNKAFNNARFWAKLADVNTIQCTAAGVHVPKSKADPSKALLSKTLEEMRYELRKRFSNQHVSRGKLITKTAPDPFVAAALAHVPADLSSGWMRDMSHAYWDSLKTKKVDDVTVTRTMKAEVQTYRLIPTDPDKHLEYQKKQQASVNRTAGFGLYFGYLEKQKNVPDKVITTKVEITGKYENDTFSTVDVKLLNVSVTTPEIEY